MAEGGEVAMKTRGDGGQRRRLAPGGEPADEGTRVRGRAGLARGEQSSSPSLIEALAHTCATIAGREGGLGARFFLGSTLLTKSSSPTTRASASPP